MLRLITAFTRTRQLSLSLVRPIQFMPSHSTSWKPILILSVHLHLDLPCGLFPLGFPLNSLRTFPLPHACHMLRGMQTFLCVFIFYTLWKNTWTVFTKTQMSFHTVCLAALYITWGCCIIISGSRPIVIQSASHLSHLPCYVSLTPLNTHERNPGR